jgi:4-amino-4-deoxychorismate lyase
MTQVLRSRSEILSALESALHPFESKILAMYNSRIRAIITDPLLMSVSIDDHMVHRAHSVFDTLTICNGRAYNLNRHLTRIENSARLAQVQLPLAKTEMAQILLDLAACANRPNLSVRYWVSAGPGSLAIHPVEGQSTFYAVAYESHILAAFGVRDEFTVSVPMKPQLLANMKSTNYLINALCAMESASKGGRTGLQIHKTGYVAEGSVNNVCFVMSDKTLVTPPFDDILNGTTIERVFAFAEQMIKEGMLRAVEQRPISVVEAKTAVEMMTTGGDSISAVLNWDGERIGNGEQGPVTTAMKEMMKKDFENPDLTIPVNYSAYLSE